MTIKLPQKPRKRKTFERSVGQAFRIEVPDGYLKMNEEQRRPRPAVALTIIVHTRGEPGAGRNGLITSIRLADEPAARSPHKAITLEHPAVVKLLADYSPIEHYEIERGALTVHTYSRCPAEPVLSVIEGPVLIETGPGSFIVAEEEPLPVPSSPAALAASGLKALYPKLSGRIDKALKCVETGKTQFDYKTEWDNAGRLGCWSCDCKDAQFNKPRTEFGAACYHALTGLILQLVKREQNQIKQRRLADYAERQRARVMATAGAYEVATKADPLNMTGDRRAQFGRGR